MHAKDRRSKFMASHFLAVCNRSGFQRYLNAVNIPAAADDVPQHSTGTRVCVLWMKVISLVPFRHRAGYYFLQSVEETRRGRQTCVVAQGFGIRHFHSHPSDTIDVCKVSSTPNNEGATKSWFCCFRLAEMLSSIFSYSGICQECNHAI